METSHLNTTANKTFTPSFEHRHIYKTVEQFSIENPCFTTSSLRNLIFKAEERHSTNGVIAGNGLLEFGAIIRIGRKVLINEDRFFQWIESHQFGGEK